MEPRPLGIASAFVGRQHELSVLRARLDDALEGAGSVALIAGEAGIGKTALVEELGEDARARGVQVLWGRCTEGEGAPVFWPWVQILRALEVDDETTGSTTGGDRDRPPGQAAAGSTALARLAPIEGHRPLTVTASYEPVGDHARFTLFDQVARELINRAARRPVVLIFDDLHWADAASLQLLLFVAREISAVRLLIVGTYRDAEAGRGHPLTPLLTAATREGWGEPIALQGLDQPAVAQFIESIVWQPPAPALAAAVWQRTEGNPFFVSQIVRLLVEEGRLGGQQTPSPSELGIPAGVRTVVGQRIGRLSPDCAEMLAVAAVLGREFDVVSLEHVLDPPAGTTAPGEALLALLEEAEAARVVGAIAGALGRYRFAHALIRDTLYDELPAARRIRLHRRAGDALAQRYAGDEEPHLTELAHHFVQAAPGGDAERALTYARRAGDRALALLAYEEAARHYRLALQALELGRPADQGARVDLLLALGDAEQRLGELGAAAAAFAQAGQLARTLADHDRLARAALGWKATRGATEADHGQRIELLEAALRAHGDQDSPTRARLLAALAEVLNWRSDWRRADELTREAVAIARRLDDPAALAYTLNARHWALWGAHDVTDQLATATELVRLAGASGDRELAIEGHALRLSDLLEAGDRSAMEAELTRYSEAAAALRQPRYRWFARVFAAMRDLLDGRFDQAEEAARQAYRIGQQVRDDDATIFYGIQTFLLRREQGRLAEIEAAVRALAERYQQFPAWRCGLAWLYAETDQLPAARAVFERLIATNLADLPRDGNWPVALTALTEACAALGDARAAALLYDCLVPYAGRAVIVGGFAACYGSADRSLGRLATVLRRWPAAERHFEAALAFNEQLGARAWSAHTRHEYAAMLIERVTGDHRSWPAVATAPALMKAGEMLGDALATAEQLAMPRLTGQTRALWERLTALTPAAPVTAARPVTLPDGLTAREVEVLRLLASGHTSKEIATALVVSVHTVHNHLASIYAKIGARRRADAATYAQRNGLT